MAPGWFPTTLTVFLVSLRTCTYAGGGTTVPPKVSLELSPSFPSDGYTQAPAPQSKAHIVVGRGGQGFGILESRVKGQVIVVCA